MKEEEEELAGKDAKEHHKKEKDALKKRLDAVDNSTTVPTLLSSKKL